MRVAIVGAGISGLTTALRLQQLGVTTTVWTERDRAAWKAGRIENLVARFPATRDRERALAVDHWDDDDIGAFGLDLDVPGTPLGFRGRFARAVQGVDFRLYLARLLDDYVERGGVVVAGSLPATPAELTVRTSGHDVVVVAAGRRLRVVPALFPVCRDRSPYSAPQRRLVGGLYRGVAASEPPAISFNLVPGAGEIFQQPFLTDRGRVAAILVEAVPGGPLEPVTRIDPETDPGAHVAALLRTIDQFAPTLASRIDPRRFGPLGARDVLRGAVTPTVRSGSAVLADGRLALAVGDAWIVNDPLTGQGANLASSCGWHLADALATAERCDIAFAQRLEDILWSFAGPITAWTNAFLLPPPPHVVDLLSAASAHQAVADAFVNGFADPARLAHDLATPAATAAFVQRSLDLVQA